MHYGADPNLVGKYEEISFDKEIKLFISITLNKKKLYELRLDKFNYLSSIPSDHFVISILFDSERVKQNRFNLVN